MKRLIFILLLFPLIGFSQNTGLRSGSSFITFNNEGAISPAITVPYASDLLLNYSIRSGNYFIDEISNDTAEILIPEFYGDASARLVGNSLRSSELTFDGNDHTIYFRLKQIDSVYLGGTSFNIIQTGISGRFIRIYYYYQHVRIVIGDGTTTSTGNIYSINNGLLNYDYVDFVINIEPAGNTCTTFMYTPDGVELATDVRDISAFVYNNNVNSTALQIYSTRSVVSNFKKSKNIKNISECLNNADTTGLELFYPHILSGVNALADSNHLTRNFLVDSNKKYVAFNSYLLDYGFNDYQKGTFIDEEIRKKVPLLYNNTDVYDIDWLSPTNVLSGFRIMGEKKANTQINTTYDSKVRFNNSFFDRSNAIIWGDSARVGYYDATDSTTFHVSELNQRTLYEWLNDGYKGRLFVDYTGNSIERFDRTSLDNIYLYNTDKTNTDNSTVLSYTGDNIALTGNIIGDYPELGYLQTDSAMLVIRFDDADTSINGNWKTMIDSFGVKPIVGIHAGLAGTIDAYTYSTWDQLEARRLDGWEFADHNYFDVDYNGTDQIDSIEYYMNLSTTTTIDSLSGYNFKYYIGNRHSSASPSLDYYTHKIGRKAHIPWGVYSDTNGTNYKKIDPFRMSAMAADLNGPYNLLDTDNTQEIQNLKDQIDKCKNEGRLAIVFCHIWTQKKSDGLAEVIQNAVDNNVGLVSFSKAINNLKYLPK